MSVFGFVMKYRLYEIDSLGVQLKVNDLCVCEYIQNKRSFCCFSDIFLKLWKMVLPTSWITQRWRWTSPDRTRSSDSRSWPSEWWPTSYETLTTGKTSTSKIQVRPPLDFIDSVFHCAFYNIKVFLHFCLPVTQRWKSHQMFFSECTTLL